MQRDMAADGTAAGVSGRNPVVNKTVYDVRYAGNVTIHRGSPAAHRIRNQKVVDATTKQQQEIQIGIGSKSNTSLNKSRQLAQKVKDSCGILVPANRFPFSSTPTGSPTQQEVKNKENFKKPIYTSSKTKRIIRDPPSKPMLPITVSKIDVGNETESTESISPIRGTSSGRNRRKVLMTQEPEPVDISRRLLMTRERDPVPSKMISAAKIPFPFPEVHSYDSLDRDTLMLNNLRLLYEYRSLKVFEEKIEKKIKDGIYATKRKKKVLANNNSSPSFILKKGMFSAPNTQAFIPVYHLLVECYDAQLCETEFRDAWPVFDKKVEALFRRAVLKSLKIMFQNHPEHFSHIKQETLIGLINKPGGDRFIQLTESVIEAVLTRVILELGGNSQKILEKPKYSPDPEITNRQLLGLHKVIQQVSSRVCTTGAKNCSDLIAIDQRISMLTNREAEWVTYTDGLLLDFEEIFSLVQNQMSEFQIDLDNEVSGSWFEDLKEAIRKPDPEILDMTLGMEKLLVKSAADSQHKITCLGDTLKDFQLLRFILTMDRSKVNEIDGKKLFLLESSKPATLTNFYNSVASLVKKFLNDPNLNGTPKKDVVKEFKTVNYKFELLKVVQQQVNNSSVDVGSLRKYVDSSLNDLQIKLKNTNWSSYSKVNDESLVSLFEGSCLLTQVDLKRQTGLTPGINKFMTWYTTDHSCDMTDGKDLPQSSNSIFDTERHNQSNAHIQINKSITSEIPSVQVTQTCFENGTPNTSRKSKKLVKSRVSFLSNLQHSTDSPISQSSPVKDDNAEDQTDSGLPRKSPPVVKSAPNKARLSHILNSLRAESPRSFSDSRHSTPGDTPGEVPVPNRRKSARFSTRLSLTPRTSEGNVTPSLIEDWKDEIEIGIMEIERVDFNESD